MAEGGDPATEGSGGRTPEELQKRIDELKHPRSAGDGATARGLGLATSLGAVFLGSIIGSYYLGQMLDDKLNSTLYTPLAMMAGVLVGFVVAWRLLQPFLGDKK